MFWLRIHYPQHLPLALGPIYPSITYCIYTQVSKTFVVEHSWVDMLITSSIIFMCFRILSETFSFATSKGCFSEITDGYHSQIIVTSSRPIQWSPRPIIVPNIIRNNDLEPFQHNLDLCSFTDSTIDVFKENHHYHLMMTFKWLLIFSHWTWKLSEWVMKIFPSKSNLENITFHVTISFSISEWKLARILIRIDLCTIICKEKISS